MANGSERDEFSKRFRTALRQANVPVDSPTRLAEDFSLRYPEMPVTQQAVRKWLNGEAIPTQSKIQALATWLAVGTEWLRYGKEVPEPHTAQQTRATYRNAFSDQEMAVRYRQLSPLHQQVVSEVVTSFLTKRKLR